MTELSGLAKEIQRLQRLQAKIDLYNMVVDNLKNEQEDPEGFPGLTQEVAEEVTSFCKKMISRIEGGDKPVKVNEMTPPAESAPVDRNPANADAFGEVEEPSQKMGPPAKKKQIIVDPNETPNDPLKFIVKYKDWVEKKALVKDGAGNTVEGTVMGAAFPNLKVEINGQLVVCSPKDMQLL